MAEKARVARILHCFERFGGNEATDRAVGFINASDSDYEHAIVSREAIEPGSGARIARRAQAAMLEKFPSLEGRPSPGKLVAIAQAMQPFDLVLTYDYGALNATMAHTVFAQALNLPPLVHHELTGGSRATQGQKCRDWYRRIAFGRTNALVVPGPTSARTAVRIWKVPPDRIVEIPGGIDTAVFARKPQAKALRLVKRKGEYWIGSLADSASAADLDLLVRACAGLPEQWHLVIFGGEANRDAAAETAASCDTSDRVHFAGAIDDPAKVIGLLDIYASASDEMRSGNIIRAMAAGLPVAAKGDEAADLVAAGNRPLIAPSEDAHALREALKRLAGEEALRKELGTANRERAREQYDEARMIEAHRALYREILRSAQAS